MSRVESLVARLAAGAPAPGPSSPESEDPPGGSGPPAPLDALLVSDLTNLRWVTGFTGSSGCAVVGPDLRVFVTDFRYLTQAPAQIGPDYELRQAQQDLLAPLGDVLPARTGLRLGFDDAHLTVKQHNRLRARIPDSVELVPAGGLVEALRMVKDADELARIRAAAALADDAFAATIQAGLVGRTERDVGGRLEDEMRERGAQEPSFPSIVACGAHGALPHAVPRDVPIPPGTLVVIDWGARLDGYCSDCTRTVATGTVDEESRRIYDVVLRAQEAALAAVRPGPLGRDVDAIAREHIARMGYGERFGHGLGHGVGLEVHEEPRLSKNGEVALEAGNVVTVEPGVYVPDHVGVRIEDLVIVTDEGHEVVSGHPKALWTVT